MNYRKIIELTNNCKIHISPGNSKIGKIPTFNMLPGAGLTKLRNGDYICNVEGTCKGVCEGCEKNCYAVKGLKAFYASVAPSNGENTLIMRKKRDEGFSQIEKYCVKNKPKAFRFHSSGEIIDYDYLKKMRELALKIKNTQFYVYTKRFDEVQQLICEFGKLPDNFVINISEWNHNTDGYDFSDLNKFVWDDGTDPEIAKLPHCPSVSKPTRKGGKGRMTETHCDTCGLCWKKNTGKRIAVYNH